LALCALPHGAGFGEDFASAPIDDYSLVQTDYPATAWGPAAGPAANGLPMLESLPGAPTAAYLDFDGFSGNGYGGAQTFEPYDTNGDPANFNATEAANITEGWRRIAQYMAPFNINVTTIVPTVPYSWNVISNSLTGVGYSYLQFNGSAPSGFNPSGDLLNRTTGILHELGHNFGLAHQSEYDLLANKTREYRNGYDSLHGAVMGIDYFGSVPKWYVGHPSNSPSTLQDDVARIAAVIHQFEPATGDGFRPDDFGGTIAAAATLTAGNGVQSASGIIERPTDADAFSFTSAGGTVTIDAVRDGLSGVDLRLEVRAADGSILAASDLVPNDQHLTLVLPAGTFYAVVTGHGDYGDIGGYRLSVQSLPDGWSHVDIGSVGKPGSASHVPPAAFTVTGSGSGISGTADEFHYAYQTLTGDGAITARVTSVQNTDASAKAGVMIREALTTGSKHAYMLATPSNGTWLRSRGTSGGASDDSPRVNETFSAIWVRLERVGNTLTGASSTDGVNWTVEGSATINMSPSVMIGLATTATDDNDLNASTYDSVTVTGNLAPPGPTLNLLPAPTGLAVTTATTSGLNLSWNDVAGETGYRIERSADGATYDFATNVAAGATTFADGGLIANSRYFYRVRANDATGTSAPSVVKSGLTRPGVVTELAITAWTDTQLIVNWRDTSGETGYRIERSSDGLSFSPIATVGVNVPSFTDTGLTPATQYYYRVVTLDALGDAAISASVNGTSRVSAVSNFAFGAVTSSQVNLQWSDVAAESGYRIERSTDNETFSTIGNIASNAVAFTDNSVEPLHEYYYRVTPMNGSTPGLESTTIFTATPGGALPTPWVSQDIGTVPGKGASGYDNGTFTLLSAGADLSGTADSFHFVHQPFAGDGTIIARVTQIEDTDDNADAGLIFRESLAAGSRYVALVVTHSEGIKLRSRIAAGADATSVTVAGAAPSWLRLDRFGRTFRAFTSTNSQSWTHVGDIVLNLPSSLFVGLASTSRDDEVLNASTFEHVSVGPAVPLAQPDEYALNEDTALATSSVIETVVPAGSTWKYLDDATDQGTNWRATGYSDGAWSSGAGPFGFGDPGLGTTTRGAVGGQPVITTYFRHAFSLSQIASIRRLLIELQRDDGAAVYLNGVEIARSNLPAGADFNDLAPERINDADELVYHYIPLDVASLTVGVPPGTLIEGTNVLAVEVHQQAASSTDLRFDLALRVTRGLTPGPAENDLHFDPDMATVEIAQPPSHGTAIAQAGNFTFTPTADYFGADSFSYRVVAPAGPIVPMGSTWRYLDNGSNQGVAWRSVEFNDNPWVAGPAQFGYGEADEATVVSFGPSATNKHATTYFRHAITLPDGVTARDLSLRLLRDDAAAIYLNGVEVYRDANLPAAAAHNRYATSDLGNNEALIVPIPLPGRSLASGLNVIAVEVHQATPGSSDVSFDLELSGRLVSAPAIVSLAIAAVDDEPAAVADAFDAQMGQSLTVAAPGVLANDANPDNEPITATVTSLPTHGVLALAANGSFTYTPQAGYSGADSFSYRVTDGDTPQSALPATVTLTIHSAGVRGDFTGDGRVRADDIDALAAAILAASAEPRFDLNADTLVNETDRNILVGQLVETTLGLGTSYGDANLDGAVDRADVALALGNLTYLGAPAWSRGDFTGDGRVDLADIARQQQNLNSTAAPSPAAPQSAAATIAPRRAPTLTALRVRISPPRAVVDQVFSTTARLFATRH
jgi:regulation of enolase protein 1 (concanavalin A-like superfamily)